MPFIIPAIVTAIGLTGIAATIATVLLEVAFAIGSSLLVNALFGPGAPQRQASVTKLAIGESPRLLIQGMAGVGGTLADAFNWGGDFGTDYECQIIVLADHKCHSLVEFYVNDNKIAYPGGGFSGGFVPDTNGAKYNGQLQVFWLDGSAVQTLPSIVTNGGWSTTGNFSGISVAVVAYKADDPQADNPVWSGGRPTFLWVVKGKEQYDPRLDDTVDGGSGPHRWEDPSTWEWTDNASVCRYNWVRGIYALDQVTDPQSLLIGRGLSAIEAPPENVFAYANICDEDVALVSGGSANILAIRVRDTRGRYFHFDGRVYAGVTAGSNTWRYLATALSDNVDRAAINFDDSGWSSASGTFGNHGDANFIAENAGAWFRMTCDVSVDSVQFNCDDCADVWYNGAYIGFFDILPGDIRDHTVSLGSVAARTSEKRYTVNGVVKSNEKYVDTETMYADAMGGIVIQPGGSVEVEPGHARTPTFTITDDDLVSGTRVAFSGFRSAADNAWINTVVPRYVEPSQKWQDHGAPVRRVDADVTADRGARELSLTLAQVTSGTQAQRLGEIQRRLGRLVRTATLTLGPRFGGIEEGDWGTWTSNRYFDGTSITWRVDAYRIDEKRQVNLTLREINSGVYDWSTADELSTDVANTPTTVPDPAWLSAYGPAGLLTIQLIAQSYPTGLTITGSTTAIVISNHTRVYSDRSVAVTGATISGSFTAGKRYWVYYDDAARAGGAVAYHATLVEADAEPSSTHPFRHTIGSVVIPSAGTVSGVPATSKGNRAYGFAYSHPDPVASKLLAEFDSPVAWGLSAGLTDCQGTIVDSDANSAAAPSADTTFDIQSPPGTSIGSMTFAASSLTATFAMTDDQSIPLGQLVEIWCPANLHGIAGRITLSIKGTTNG